MRSLNMRYVITALLVLSFNLVAGAQDKTAPAVAPADKQVEKSDTPDKQAGKSVETPVGKPDGRQSVKPGINKGFLNPELDIEEWVARFEVESREVYHARDAVIRQMRIEPGMRVADIGAGTGFFTLLMSKAVGADGWAYAVDISPKFVSHLSKLFDERSINNVTTVMCDDDSVCLPPESIDVAFICDVYHHFEYPGDTMKSLASALVDGGRVIVVDFERIPGVSREWTMGHVRAGKQTFIDEIQAAGFELIGEREIPEFKDNYYLEFQKSSK